MKRKYLVCQEGEVGCDYSLCCGKLYFLYEGQGDSLEEDIKILFEEIAYPEGRDEYCEFSKNNYGINDVFVVPIEADVIRMNIDKYKMEWEEEQKIKEKEQLENEEREEYERLKKKFS